MLLVYINRRTLLSIATLFRSFSTSMGQKLKMVMVVLVVVLGLSAVSMARELPVVLPGFIDGGSGDCWMALAEMKSCKNEIVLFFINGESYLGMDCCRAIRVLTHQCWPSLLTTIGFDAEQGDILRGFCDASFPDDGSPPSVSPGPATCK